MRHSALQHTEWDFATAADISQQTDILLAYIIKNFNHPSAVLWQSHHSICNAINIAPVTDLIVQINNEHVSTIEFILSAVSIICKSCTFTRREVASFAIFNKHYGYIVLGTNPESRKSRQYNAFLERKTKGMTY